MKSIAGIKVRQWSSDWDDVKWDPKQHRAEPQHWFYQFSIPASLLRSWSGVNARSMDRKKGAEDLGIQRRHEPDRSSEIGRYVRFGFPWCDLSEKKRRSHEFTNLRKPGWLPTSLVVNVLTATDKRAGKSVARDDLIRVEDRPDGTARLHFPKSYSGANWKIESKPPIEVIDGQHRLWAFDPDARHDFEVPVVAFVGLDLSWQAYLFYTINIKPKRINASLAFDLYPLLRAEDWLENFGGHIVYRETRAQEIVDLLWAAPESPWHKRINMLGEPGHRGRMVTQAAWVRALLATFVKSWEGPGVKLGGLFGAPVGSDQEVLSWSRIEQGAFLIFVSRHLRDAIREQESNWTKHLREPHGKQLFQAGEDAAFYGDNSLLGQDQGIRALLHVFNDLFFVHCDPLNLKSIATESATERDSSRAVSIALKAFGKARPFAKFTQELSDRLASYDWRASSAAGLSEEEALRKQALRGSGGYKELRKSLLTYLAEGNGEVSTAAKAAKSRLGY